MVSSFSLKYLLVEKSILKQKLTSIKRLILTDADSCFFWSGALFFRRDLSIWYVFWRSIDRIHELFTFQWAIFPRIFLAHGRKVGRYFAGMLHEIFEIILVLIWELNPLWLDVIFVFLLRSGWFKIWSQEDF